MARAQVYLLVASKTGIGATQERVMTCLPNRGSLLPPAVTRFLHQGRERDTDHKLKCSLAPANYPEW